MTGFGRAAHSQDGQTVTVEIRSVNNRHLKLNIRGSDPYPLLESDVEKIIRPYVKRGSVLLHIKVDRPAQVHVIPLNQGIIQSYLEQLTMICQQIQKPDLLPSLVQSVMTLPGIASDSSFCSEVADVEWNQTVTVIEEAVQQLVKVRKEEGATITADLLHHADMLQEYLQEVRRRAPKIVHEYRERLLERIRQAIAEAGVNLQQDQVIREVSLFADRSDISEELSRLSAHLDRFVEIVKQGQEGAGRRLEFLVQEIGREVNTLGSKASDVTISGYVVEMKATLERIREQIQNVE